MPTDFQDWGDGGTGLGLGGGDSYTSTGSTTDARAIEYARILDLVSEGPIVGLVDGLKSVFLDDTPIQNGDNSLNFSGLILQAVAGTGTQAPIPGFPSAETETSVTTKVSVAGGPVTRTISTAGVSAVRVKIKVPALKVINTSNGKESGTTVIIKVEIQSASYNGGAWTQVKLDGDDYQGKITGKFGTAYTRSYRIGLPAAGPWQVRVTRLTPDAPDAYTQNETWWDSYTELTDARLCYPHSALFALEVDSQQFRSIPRRAYEIKGRIVKVPVNYDPTTRVYTGIWNGTFKDAWTDNPAWVFYDLATNTRYGAGSYLDASLIDKWTLYQCAQYCDELVDNGRGGTEPRFACNLYLQTQEEAIRVLTNLLGIFRAMAYEAGGTIVPVQDAPSDPVAIFTNSNVRDGAFTYSGTSRRQRHTAALVGWNDPNDGYRLVPEVVEDQAGIARYGYQPMEATALGCTSQGQARRYGLWLLASEMTETESVSFSAALEGAAVVPGEVIQINDQHRAGSSRWGGRIVSATTTAVTLDAPVTLGAGSYTLKCTLPNGTVESRTVTGGAGTRSTLTVGTAYSQAPGDQAQWLLMDSAVTPRLYRVVSIGEGDGLEHEIMAVEHNPAKYAAVESGLTLGPGVSGGPRAFPPVTSLTLSSSVEVRFGARIMHLEAKWVAPTDATGYRAVASRDNGPWEAMEISAATARLWGAEEGSYRVRVVAVYAGGTSPYSEASATVSESTAVPSGLGSAADVAAAQSTANSAASAASAAQSSANAANAALSDIAADDKLTPSEKQKARLEWDTILGERAGIQAQADTFVVSRTAYDADFQALATYLNNGTAWSSGTPSWLSDANLGTTTTIVGSTFRANWKALYDERQALLNAISAKAKTLADGAQTTANSAASAASAAQSSANAANAALSDIAADDKLTPSEKQKARLEWDTILGERSGIQAHADAFAVSRTAYDADFQALATYLNNGTAWSSGTPSWLSDANLSTTTTIVGATFRSKWKDLYDERQALLNAISAKAKTLADGAQTTANSAAIAAAAADAIARESFNLIKNGNSENANPTGYEANGVNSTPGYARNGSKCRIILTGTAYTSLTLTPKIQCAEGDEFYFEGWCKSTVGTYSYSPRLRMRFSNPTSGTLLWAYDYRLSLSTTYQKLSISGTAPAGTTHVEFLVDSGPNAIAEGLIAWDDFFAGLITKTYMLAAYSVTAAKIATDAIKTSDYAEDAYGNPTAGAWMGVNTTNPIKCGPNGLKIGKGIFNQQSLVTERIANGFFWKSAEGWALTGTNAPVWSATNPHTTGCGNVMSERTGSVPAYEGGGVNATGSVSQVLQLGVPDPNAAAQNLTLWLRSEYAVAGTGASFTGVSGYAKVYLTNLGSGGAETLIGTLSITTANTWTQGTFNLNTVYTGAGAYGLRIEISSTTTVAAGTTSATVTARARLADVKFTA